MLILVPIAFLSGALTVLSPCILPILPVVLASGMAGSRARIQGLITGIVTGFFLITISLTVLVSRFGLRPDTIRTIAVFLLIFFGFSLAIPQLWERFQSMLEKYIRIKPAKSENPGFWSSFLTGMSLGVIWLPCAGPIVGAIATLAALNELSLNALGILLAYAAGIGSLLYLIALGSSRLTFFKQNNLALRRIFGIVIIATALCIAAGWDKDLQRWTLDHLPDSWTNLPGTFEEQVNTGSRLEVLNSD
ncbi:MAG TPA: cytochrome c biogenesis CcdA family protein [bacterium]|nr:cytochrome c biogenesis CcdA family protein [bacterium]